MTLCTHFVPSLFLSLSVVSGLGLARRSFFLAREQFETDFARKLGRRMTRRKILGIIPLGTSLSAETSRTISLGCWDCHALLTPSIDSWTTNTSNPDFVPDDSYCNYLVDTGFGDNCEKEVREFWMKEIKDNYRGDEGRRRIRMAAINLRDRDGLRGRLWDVRCPVIWLHVSTSILHLPFSYFLVLVSC